ncbi:2-dehydro-3-deoxygalactonokinase [Microbulbifer agarilyticus]|uniref:2-dehydro-3-deoxygalactonokinase n=1 Tax=Microbulbifer agarilyticus TaxID=260552 RepID=UPI001C977B48|nr:2-dehydro-3-deoxygalactonokinase [Microbulbifer agarilyticus]MBY6212054.1 2-dehydro-3-deoxygalactonokinase [Microbulbifer agarilyticus]
MGEILVCDWGTSSFRLMRVSASGEILAQVATDQGVKQLNPEDMEAYLKAQMATLGSVNDLVILCGMVGSGIGWYEVPYVNCPASMYLLSEALVQIPNTELRAWCVPGVKLETPDGRADVMRGEETQVIGWLSEATQGDRAKSVLCLPGTHSKWVQIECGEICEFSTAFTGELYALLNEYSVLVQGEQTVSDVAFTAGLAVSEKTSGLIHQLFNARSRSLLGMQSPMDSASFLSGMLIGSEVGAMAASLDRDTKVHLICGDYLAEPYGMALKYFDVPYIHYSGNTYSALGLKALADASSEI